MTDTPGVETQEAQNQGPLDEYRQLGPCTMGPWTSYSWRHDARHLLFVLARYKFVAKMLAGAPSVLEVGCGDAIGLPLVRQVVDRLHAVDFEPLVIEDARRRFQAEQMPAVTFAVHDAVYGPVEGNFDAAYSLDVIEHVPKEVEDAFLSNLVASIRSEGVVILGTPNVTGSQYASELSELGHVNLKGAEEFRVLMSARFKNVFCFSMNDEMVHTGFAPMAHYLLAIGVGVRR